MITSRLDQPDNYSGKHNLVTVAYISIDTSTAPYTGHLLMNYPGAPVAPPSYCGKLNPCKVGKYLHIPTIGQIARSSASVRYKGKPVTVCSDCLSMALCQAEMIGQTAYRVKTIMRAMDKLPGR